MTTLSEQQIRLIQLRIKAAAFYSAALYVYQNTKEKDRIITAWFVVAERQMLRTRRLLETHIPQWRQQ